MRVPGPTAHDPRPSVERRAGALLLAVLAAGSASLLVSLQYGLAEEYGAGLGASLAVFALVPIILAVAAAVALKRRSATIVAVTFSVAVVAAAIAAGPLGERAKERQAAERDATFACNGPNSEFLVPEEVDEGWDDFDHPFRVYGPISQSRYGCTAAIEGPVSETWAPWRRSLLGSGWEVEQDTGSRVSVTDGVLRAKLEQQDGLSLVTLETVLGDACQRRDQRHPDPQLDAVC